MKIAYITAGGGGMYCGSCMHDNTLARALIARNHDVCLVPTYTPIRVDEENVSYDRVFLGGINVYLQQKSFIFRMLPRFLDRWLSGKKLLKKVASGNVETNAKFLGEMTLSLSKGMHGKQKKEIAYLVDWLANDLKPDLLVLTNLLIGSFVPAFKARHNVPVLVNLQGDDYFLDSLGEPWRTEVMANLKAIATQVDGFVVNSNFYADKMAQYFDFPRKKAFVVPLGIDTNGYPTPEARQADHPPTLGYLARICPEKGFHHAVEGFLRARKHPGLEDLRFRFSGWLGKSDQAFFEAQMARIREAGAAAFVAHLDVQNLDAKYAFFKNIDLFTVPAEFEEPKGLPVLEALAAGVPFVAPAHGAFPELVDRLAGGKLYTKGDLDMYETLLVTLLKDKPYTQQLGALGRSLVLAYGSMEMMAADNESLFQRILNPPANLEPLPPLGSKA